MLLAPLIAGLFPFLPLAIAGSGRLTRITPGKGSAPAVVNTEVTSLPIAQYVQPLVGSTPRSASKKAALRHVSGGRGLANVAGAEGDREYLTNITVGGQPFTVVIDTGRYV